MALRRTSVEQLIQKQRIRRRGNSGAPRRWGGWFALAGKVFAILAGLSLLGAGGYFGYRFSLSNYFELKKLVITGVSDGVAAEIAALARLEPNAGINLLFVREKRIRETVLKHPRVESAVVAKCYPNALMIEARERQPVAIVACGALYWIDRDGYVLDTVAHLDRSQSPFPFLTGIAADQIVFGQPIPTKAVGRALDLYACLQEISPSVHRALSEIRVGPDDGLTLVLSGGVEVRFGTGEFADRLSALDLFAQKHRDFESLEYIDLRFDNQVVYRPRGGGESSNAPATGRPWPADRTRREL
jgi:cell division septal protein FtsQ